MQQPYEISIVLGMKEQQGISLSCQVYPNPSTSYLVLEVENDDFSDLQYQLYDMAGKLLKNDRVVSMTSRINMSDYVPASYLLQVLSGSKTI